MKNNYDSTESPSVFKTLLLIIIVSLAMSAAKAQNSFISVQISRDITGSGLGGNVCPALSITRNQHTLTAGPNFQRKYMHFSGVQANYRYAAATRPGGKLELFFSANLTYHYNARMSDSYIEIENNCHKEEHRDFSLMRFKVFESYAGTGLKWNPGKHFSALAGVGIGMYHTCNKGYDQEMFRLKSSMAIRMNFSLIYHFKTTKTNH